MQARQDANLQHPVLETGALPIGATGLSTRQLFDPCLHMKGVLPVERAVLSQLELALELPVLLRGVVASVALGTCEGDDLDCLSLLCHLYALLSPITKEPPTGLEPVTPSLPWMCSTD